MALPPPGSSIPSRLTQLDLVEMNQQLQAENSRLHLHATGPIESNLEDAQLKLFSDYINEGRPMALDLEQAAASSFLRLILRDVRLILYNHFHPEVNQKYKNNDFFQLCLSKHYECLYAYFYENNNEPIQRFIEFLKKCDLAEEDLRILALQADLFTTSNTQLFSNSILLYLNVDKRLVKTALAAVKSLGLLYIKVKLLNECINMGISQYKPSEPKSEILVLSTEYLDIISKILLFKKSLLRKKDELASVIQSSLSGLATLKTHFADLLDENKVMRVDLSSDFAILHSQELRSFYNRTRAFSNWSKSVLKEGYLAFDALGKIHLYIQDIRALKRLETLCQKSRRPFNDLLKEELIAYASDSAKGPNWLKATGDFLKKLYQSNRLLLEGPLEETSLWIDAIDNPEKKSRELVASAKPLSTLDSSSLSALTKALREDLKRVYASQPSAHARNTLWHLQSILLRLTSLNMAPKTMSELRATALGLVVDVHLSLEQTLTALMRRDDPKKGVLAHDLIQLFYQVPFHCSLDENIRENLLELNGGEFLVRTMHLCTPEGNQTEKLLALVRFSDQFPEDRLLNDSFALVKRAFQLSLHLSQSLSPNKKKGEELQKLQDKIESYLNYLLTHLMRDTWEKTDPKDFPMLRSLLTSLKDKCFVELKGNFTNLIDNFLLRLSVIRTNVLQPIQAPVALSDTLLITQMAAEELFNTLLIMDGKDVSPQMVDHDLKLLVDFLKLPIQWDADELAFLKEGKEMRRVRYPESSSYEPFKKARQLADKYPFDAAFLKDKEEGFHLNDKQLAKTRGEITREIALFETICLKVLKEWEKKNEQR